MNIFAKNEEETKKIGLAIGENLNSPVVIYLTGDLGTGKTYISKGIAEGLKIKEDITSPTFTLINEYKNDKYHLYHLDLYRLNSLSSVLDLGIEDFVSENDSVTIIEWYEKLENYKLSKNFIEIKIFYNENGRDFIIELDNYDKKNELEKRIKEIVNTWN
ncbi:MAG: tRNA (adenosine(37)-N6)-threonylcarbamoyltransferase complex ATPase subunit type 1 TsaE [Cyanobacteriota bacterium]